MMMIKPTLLVSLLSLLGAVNANSSFGLGFYGTGEKCNPGHMRKLFKLYKNVAQVAGFTDEDGPGFKTSHWMNMPRMVAEVDEAEADCKKGKGPPDHSNAGGNGNGKGKGVATGLLDGKLTCDDSRRLAEEALTQTSLSDPSDERRLFPSSCDLASLGLIGTYYDDCARGGNFRRRLGSPTRKLLDSDLAAMEELAKLECGIIDIPCIVCETLVIGLID